MVSGRRCSGAASLPQGASAVRGSAGPGGGYGGAGWWERAAGAGHRYAAVPPAPFSSAERSVAALSAPLRHGGGGAPRAACGLCASLVSASQRP